MMRISLYVQLQSDTKAPTPSNLFNPITAVPARSDLSHVLHSMYVTNNSFACLLYTSLQKQGTQEDKEKFYSYSTLNILIEISGE